MKKYLTQLIRLAALCSVSGLILTACTTESTNPTFSYNKAGASEANINLGMALMRKQHYPAAKNSLIQATKDDPQNPAAWYSLAFFYQTVGQNAQANADYQHAIAVAPHSGSAHNNYGTFLCRNGQFSSAIHQFQIAANETNYLDTAGAYENAGLCALKAASPNLAMQFFKQALNNGPNRPISLYEMARLSFQKHRIQQAKRYLKRYQQVERAPSAVLQTA